MTAMPGDTRAVSAPAVRTTTLLVLLGLVAAGAVARLAGLGGLFLSPDEATIMVIARAANVGTVWREAFTQAHPPFHFLLLHFWPDPGNSVMWLRWSSLLPGLLLIPAFYFFGRRALGEAGGLTMALLAAFGQEPVILSQVIRPYAWTLLLVTGAGWFWFDFMERGRTRSAVLYSGLLLPALALHYSAALAMAGFGLAGAVLLARGRRWKHGLVWVAAHLPLVAVGATFYFIHLAKISDERTGWMAGYLKAGFAASVTEFARLLLSLFDFFYFDATAPVFAAVAAVGVFGLVRRRNWPALSMVAGFVLAGVAPNLLHLYPLHGSRHSIWLFPALALLVAAGTTEIGFLLSMLHPLKTVAAGACQRAWVRPALILVPAVLLAAAYATPSFLPRYQMAREAELPVTKALLNWTQEFLKERAKPGDAIVTTKEMALYLKFIAGRKTETEVSPRLSKITYRGRDFYFLPESWLLTSPEIIAAAIYETDRARPIAPADTVWVFNLGWGNRSFRTAFENLFSAHLDAINKAEKKYLLIYAIPGAVARLALGEWGPAPAGRDPFPPLAEQPPAAADE